MDAIQALLTRKSIRKYSLAAVSQKSINILLKVAMQAPSAHNSQSWHFIIIRDPKSLDEIKKFHPYASMLTKASCAIAVCGDTEIEKSIEYNALNCAAATENILIAAHALGLGAVWLGIFPRIERIASLKSLLRIPDHIIPITLVSIGHPAEEKPFDNRFKADRVHIGSW